MRPTARLGASARRHHLILALLTQPSVQHLRGALLLIGVTRQVCGQAAAHHLETDMQIVQQGEESPERDTLWRRPPRRAGRRGA